MRRGRIRRRRRRRADVPPSGRRRSGGGRWIVVVVILAGRRRRGRGGGWRWRRRPGGVRRPPRRGQERDVPPPRSGRWRRRQPAAADHHRRDDDGRSAAGDAVPATTPAHVLRRLPSRIRIRLRVGDRRVRPPPPLLPLPAVESDGDLPRVRPGFAPSRRADLVRRRSSGHGPLLLRAGRDRGRRQRLLRRSVLPRPRRFVARPSGAAVAIVAVPERQRRDGDEDRVVRAELAGASGDRRGGVLVLRRRDDDDDDDGPSRRRTGRRDAARRTTEDGDEPRLPRERARVHRGRGDVDGVLGRDERGGRGRTGWRGGGREAGGGASCPPP